MLTARCGSATGTQSQVWSSDSMQDKKWPRTVADIAHNHQSIPWLVLSSVERFANHLQSRPAAGRSGAPVARGLNICNQVGTAAGRGGEAGNGRDGSDCRVNSFVGRPPLSALGGYECLAYGESSGIFQTRQGR